MRNTTACTPSTSKSTYNWVLTMNIAATGKRWIFCGLLILSGAAIGDDQTQETVSDAVADAVTDAVPEPVTDAVPEPNSDATSEPAPEDPATEDPAPADNEKAPPEQSAVESAEAGPIATTPQGKYQGLEVDGVNAFLGIPYADSAAGENRWKPPVPLPAHDDIRPSTELGPACLQTRAKRETSEDCLSLNIWTPELNGQKRPVMVWIHGGGLRSGSNDIAGQVLADSSQYRNAAVIVAINYRLGPMGFFAHRSLKDKNANFGLLDTIAALEWVQTNIASFGGDPDNVTIFGVSAGGMAVNMLMTSSLSEGLFHKAIAQSGYATWPLAHTRHARRRAALGLDGSELIRAERQSNTLIKYVSQLKQTKEMLYELPGQKITDALHGFQLPYVDGQSLKAEPGIRFAQNKQHKVPFITGGASNEGTVIGGFGVTAEEFALGFGSDAKILRKLYETDFNRDDNAGWTRVFGDTRYVLSAKVLGETMARRQPDTWLYYIDFIPESFKTKWIGTPHGMDGWLLFNGHTSKEPDIQELTENLRSYWLNFAHTGNPNGMRAAPAENAQQSLPEWPSFTNDSKHWQVLGATITPKQDVIGEKLDLLTRRYERRTATRILRRR